MSTTKLFIGNLPFSATEDEVRALFQELGEVRSIHLVNDRETGRPRGFGFVELDTEAAEKAVRDFDGMEFNGRTLVINVARERNDHRDRGDSHSQRR